MAGRFAGTGLPPMKSFRSPCGVFFDQFVRRPKRSNIADTIGRFRSPAPHPQDGYQWRFWSKSDFGSKNFLRQCTAGLWALGLATSEFHRAAVARAVKLVPSP